MYTFVLTGTTGMNKAVWRKIDAAQTGATHMAVNRHMDKWEVATVTLVDSKLTNPLGTLKRILGPVVMKNYNIKID